MAGKPQTLATTSAFEILGPVMVGPSSSHTAGALRCAQVAASLLEGRITKVTFGLWNSFAHTYRGHGTDRALVAGILGLDTDDENIKQAFDLAREQGLEYHFDIKGDDASIHPNTVDHVDVDGVGVDGGVVALDVKVKVEALVPCEVKGLLDVLVVGIEPQDARDERAIGAVAAVGVGKGVPQAKGDLSDAAFQKAGGNLGAAQGAGGVRRAGADHDGPQDLECRGRS